MKKYIFSLSITGQKTNELRKMGQIPVSSSACDTQKRDALHLSFIKRSFIFDFSLFTDKLRATSFW